jgi:cell division protein FtsL
VDRQAATLGMRLLLGVRSLPDHSLLDRIVRGRVWIPVLGVLLAGIVFTQVEVLRLNASMGQALRQNSTLAIRNQALRVSVAELSDQTRIERLAARMGMVMPGPTTLSFVPGNPSVTRGVQNIHAPAPDQFVAQLPSPASSDTTGSGGSSSSAAASGSAMGSSSGTGLGSTDTSGGSGASSSGNSSGSTSSTSSGSSSGG